ncbi:MAG: CHAT domain-containing protein [Cyanobacteria bacterium SBLK]|nr:CHAT domain-containing protein [Cyanobacteria bacterium SBLK]
MRKQNTRKIVTLTFYGDLDKQGFKVTLEISSEAKNTWLKQTISLPRNPELAICLQQHWQEKYYHVEVLYPYFIPVRIKPKKVINIQIGECSKSGEELCDRLKNWLKSDSFSYLDKQLREELQATDEICFLIRTDNLNLQKLPWHKWDFLERYSQVEIALGSTSFKSLQTPAKPKTAWIHAKIRILAILGHSEQIDIDRDRQMLAKLPDAQTVFLIEPERYQINEQLWEQSWDIIFFAGHSITKEEKGRIYINPQDSLTLDELEFGLKKAVKQGLQLAIFNSCDGLGLAWDLTSCQIPQTIVMRESVPDLVAQEFLTHFLAIFSRGSSFYVAVREARERLQGLEGRFPCASWLPIIYQNSVEIAPTWKQMKVRRSWLGQVFLSKTRTILVVLLGLIFGSLGWYSIAPQITKVIHNQWWDNYQRGNLQATRGILDFVRKITPNHRATEYTLGRLCEEVRDFDCAKKRYQSAAQYGLSSAYSDLARLYIIEDGDYAAAVTLSKKGLSLVRNDWVKYSLLKNLGWARFKQNRDEEALTHLEEAIALDSDRAGAYCLIAQIKEKQGEDAIEFWRTCLQFANPDFPDDDLWMGMARERLHSPSNVRSNFLLEP